MELDPFTARLVLALLIVLPGVAAMAIDAAANGGRV